MVDNDVDCTVGGGWKIFWELLPSKVKCGRCVVLYFSEMCALKEEAFAKK